MVAVPSTCDVNATVLKMMKSLYENENVTEKTECENESAPRLATEKPREGV